MSQTQAIFIGAAIIAASILFTNGMRPAVAMNGGPFQLEHHSNTGANAGVFRLDTATGEVSYCFINGNSGFALVCSKSVR